MGHSLWGTVRGDIFRAGAEKYLKTARKGQIFHKNRIDRGVFCRIMEETVLGGGEYDEEMEEKRGFQAVRVLAAGFGRPGARGRRPGRAGEGGGAESGAAAGEICSRNSVE